MKSRLDKYNELIAECDKEISKCDSILLSADAFTRISIIGLLVLFGLMVAVYCSDIHDESSSVNTRYTTTNYNGSN